MTNSKSTKRALFSSVVALLLCFTMLLGTTFAWFTDTVSSGSNVITSGNLDIVVEYTLDGTNWNDLDGANDLFQKGLWEPGHTEVVALRIKNNGSLALKYVANMNIVNETVGKTKDGKDIVLSDILTVSTSVVGPFEPGGFGDMMASSAISGAFKDGLVEPDNTVAFKEANILYEGNVKVEGEETFPCYLKAGDTAYVFVQVDMAESVGNEANHDGVHVPTIEFGINVLATQIPHEYDSFGNQYDKDAKYPGEVGTAAELAAALANNESVKLLNDIVLDGEWTPIGNKDEGIYYTGTLDGNGHTISGLSVKSGDYVALISAAKDATIKNLTVEGSVAGANAAGVVARVEGNTVIENVTSNVTVKGTTKAGGIACNVTNSGKTVFTNCVNNGAVSGGDSGIGGIIGYVNNDSYVEIIACENRANVTSDNNKYAGAAVGYAAGESKGTVVDMKNTGTVTGTLLNDGRFLKYGETVLCGYVGKIGNWTSALLATPENVWSVIENALEDATVQLSAGKYGTIVAKSNITLQGTPGAVVNCVNLNGASNVKLLNIEFDAAGAQLGYDGKGNAKQYANIVTGDSSKQNKGARNLEINGCTFTGTFANGGAAIAFQDQSRTSGQSGNITIKGCTFATTGGYVDIYTYYSGYGTLNIEGNTFASELIDYPIYLGRYQSGTPVVVKGNTFEKCASFDDAAYIQDHSNYGVSFDAADNTFGD